MTNIPIITNDRDVINKPKSTTIAGKLADDKTQVTKVIGGCGVKREGLVVVEDHVCKSQVVVNNSFSRRVAPTFFRRRPTQVHCILIYYSR